MPSQNAPRPRTVRSRGDVPHHGPAQAPKQNVRLFSENYLVRTIRPDDASDRWAQWMSDPEAMHMLNSPPRTWTKADVINYIKGFDQRSHLLVGVFDRRMWKHVGILTMEIDYPARRFLVNLLVGEPEYRNRGVTNEITVPFRDHFFEQLGLETMACTALAHNHVIIRYLIKTGWKLEQTLKQHVKSHSDGTMLDLCLFSISRDAWRAWKKEHLGALQMPPA